MSAGSGIHARPEEDETVSPQVLKCVCLDEDVRDLVRRHLASPDHAWSVGTYGAIGEFDYASDEPALEVDLERLSVRTARGALLIQNLDDVRAFALVNERGETREIAFCSPRGGAGRDRIGEIDDRTFDVGIASPHIDMLIRLKAGDSETAATLRGAVGRWLFEAGNPAGAAIARASPTRILASAIAHLEVHQPIPGPGERSPEGPHTHLLPKLLAKGLVHPPGSPLPDGVYCGLSLYPGRATRS